MFWSDAADHVAGPVRAVEERAERPVEKRLHIRAGNQLRTWIALRQAEGTRELRCHRRAVGGCRRLEIVGERFDVGIDAGIEESAVSGIVHGAYECDQFRLGICDRDFGTRCRSARRDKRADELLGEIGDALERRLRLLQPCGGDCVRILEGVEPVEILTHRDRAPGQVPEPLADVRKPPGGRLLLAIRQLHLKLHPRRTRGFGDGQRRDLRGFHGSSPPPGRADRTYCRLRIRASRRFGRTAPARAK